MSVIDVPGHERFVRTMVAGATGIDLFLLCIAADDGVMPQTREHTAVLRALAIDAGVVAITKTDLAAAGPRGGGGRRAHSQGRDRAQALLEHLDKDKVTLRCGDEHVLRRNRQ